MNDNFYLEKNFLEIKKSLPRNVKILVVSKKQSISSIKKLYQIGHRDFGENYVQEMMNKYHHLPNDIRWHMIGKIQKNKLKYIVPFIHLIHSIQKMEQIDIINKLGNKYKRIIRCLLQIKICQKKRKSGISKESALHLLEKSKNMKNVKIIGIMGMASKEKKIVDKEFSYLYKLYNSFQKQYNNHTTLSMGMSEDYFLAIKNGSTMIRLGTLIFGSRN